MPTLRMLVGVPASGKSTWYEEKGDMNAVYASSDKHIQDIADAQDLTYNDVFASSIKSATDKMNLDIKKAVKQERDIVWDQTNLSVSSRAKKLKQIPDSYTKIAVYFEAPPVDVLTARLKGRPGKTIPAHVLGSMTKSLVKPTVEEGFDQVEEIKYEV